MDVIQFSTLESLRRGDLIRRFPKVAQEAATESVPPHFVREGFNPTGVDLSSIPINLQRFASTTEKTSLCPPAPPPGSPCCVARQTSEEEMQGSSARGFTVSDLPDLSTHS
jgi:hypothetical protein